MNRPPSNTDDSSPGVAARKTYYWPLILAALLVLAGMYGIMFFLSSHFGEPAVKSLDEVAAADVARLTLFVIRRPDEGPDIGSPSAPWEVDPGEIEAVLASLRNARPIRAERGIWLGRMSIALTDGRKVEVLLHVTGDAQSKQVPQLRYKIEQYQYEVGPAVKVLEALTAAENRAKGRR